ncbi:isoprenyl transferase [Cytophagaceae bacterium ABcell3]|nr:isoprenyl transferase [Cytophagaceae bacterium ABcell3]
MSLKDQIDPKKLPRHIAIIMDGNGRWAKKRGAERIFGHTNAVESVRDVTEACAELGIEYLTLYAFSTENWNRPKDEVNALMGLLVSTIGGEIKTLSKNNIRLLTIGNTEELPEKCKQELNEGMEETKNNTRLNLILALSYSGRWEIANAAKKLALDVKKNKINPEDINEEIFTNYLNTSKVPDPELMIRTSGENRISNFLLWQLAYAEFHITDVLWPDFRRENLYEAIIDYQNRERRFGKTSEQLNSNS